MPFSFPPVTSRGEMVTLIRVPAFTDLHRPPSEQTVRDPGRLSRSVAVPLRVNTTVRRAPATDGTRQRVTFAVVEHPPHR